MTAYFMLIDTHAHLNFSAYKDDIEEVIKRCSDNKIGVINVGSQFSTSERAVKMAEKYPHTNSTKFIGGQSGKSNFNKSKIGVGMWAAIGLHPIHLKSSYIREKVDEDEEFEFNSRSEKFDQEKYRQLAKSKKVVAIGETGLDLFHNPDNLEKQIRTFKEEISLAMELDLPIIIHCRKANKEIIEILEEDKKKYGDKLRGVVHCFSGKLSQARKYADLGFLLGFNGIITFARDYDKVLREIDSKYMLVETDCPYLTPVPFRGKRNEPSYIKYVAEKIAEIKKISFDEVAKITANNAKKLFRI